jgi:hypothetical protein
MMMTKWIAALAAVSLAATPAAAQASRTAAPVEDTASLTGSGATIAWIMAAIMVIGAILIITQDDDDDEAPSSP